MSKSEKYQYTPRARRNRQRIIEATPGRLTTSEVNRALSNFYFDGRIPGDPTIIPNRIVTATNGTSDKPSDS